MAVQGEVQERFRDVREEFERNFAERGEVGGAVCVIVDGEKVVDLWGGYADRHSARPWEKDTICLVWSCTKGATALCAHLLARRGQLDFDVPVTYYWPEFAQQGKEEISVRLLLNHQAGLPVLRHPLQAGDLYNWPLFTGLLAAERPFWPPGTRQGYHAATFGHLIGEIVRRITGKTFSKFFRDEITIPLGLDFFIGLPEIEENRVAPTIRPDPVPAGETPWAFLIEAREDPQSIQGLITKNTGRRGADQDSRIAHASALPSQGGITNARGLAGLYAPLAQGGTFSKVSLMDDATLAAMGAVSSASAIDAVLLVGMRFSLGFMKSSDNRKGRPGSRDSIILSEAAFGHAGMGGSLGFADTIERLSFGYTMNKQGQGVLLNERGQSLVDAVYRSLGYKTNRLGVWR